MAVLIFLLFLPAFAFALALSWHPALGGARKSALNPLLLVAAYVLLVAADFSYIAATGSGMLARTPVFVTLPELLAVSGQHAIMVLALLLGAAIALQLTERTPRHRSPQPGRSFKQFWLVAYLFLLGSWAFILSQYLYAGFNLEGAVYARRQATGDAFMFVVGLLLLPAFAFFLYKRNALTVLLVFTLSIVILAFGGTRTRILFLLIPMAFYIHFIWGYRIPRVVFPVVVVLGIAASVLSVNYRLDVTGLGSYGANIYNPVTILRSNDISIAESGISLSRIPRERLEGYPGENFVGFFLAPFPRALVPMRPDTGSNQFTAIFDPVGWVNHARGLTIGGINEIRYDYPLPVALVVILLLGSLWSWAFAVAIRRGGGILGFTWTVGLYVSLFTFLRGDLQSAGRIFWVFAVLSLVHLGLRHSVGRTATIGIARLPSSLADGRS